MSVMPASVMGTFATSSTTNTPVEIVPSTSSLNHSAVRTMKHAGPKYRPTRITSMLSTGSESLIGRSPLLHLLPPQVPVHDGALAQGLDPRFDLALVSHDDDVEVVGVDVLARDALHVGGGHGGDALGVVDEVVERQAVHEQLPEPRRRGAGRLEVRRQAERDVRLRLGELAVGHGLVPDTAQLLQKLDQRAVGLGGHDRRA